MRSVPANVVRSASLVCAGAELGARRALPPRAGRVVEAQAPSANVAPGVKPTRARRRRAARARTSRSGARRRPGATRCAGPTAASASRPPIAPSTRYSLNTRASGETLASRPTTVEWFSCAPVSAQGSRRPPMSSWRAVGADARASAASRRPARRGGGRPPACPARTRGRRRGRGPRECAPAGGRAPARRSPRRRGRPCGRRARRRPSSPRRRSPSLRSTATSTPPRRSPPMASPVNSASPEQARARRQHGRHAAAALEPARRVARRRVEEVLARRARVGARLDAGGGVAPLDAAADVALPGRRSRASTANSASSVERGPVFARDERAADRSRGRRVVVVDVGAAELHAALAQRGPRSRSSSTRRRRPRLHR